MPGGEIRPIAPEEYGILLMEAFADVEYEETAPQDSSELAKIGIQVTGVKKRSKSVTDRQEPIQWTGVDIVATAERFGILGSTRLIVVNKKSDAGQVDIVLFSSMERVGIVKADYELPPEFDAQSEFRRGLHALAGAQ